MRERICVLCKLLLVGVISYLIFATTSQWSDTAVAADLKAMTYANEQRMREAAAEQDPELRSELMRQIYEDYCRFYTSIGK